MFIIFFFWLFKHHRLENIQASHKTQSKTHLAAIRYLNRYPLSKKLILPNRAWLIKPISKESLLFISRKCECKHLRRHLPFINGRLYAIVDYFCSLYNFLRKKEDEYMMSRAREIIFKIFKIMEVSTVNTHEDAGIEPLASCMQSEQ